MIRMHLGAVGVAPRMNAAVAYLRTDNGMVLPVIVSHLSAVNFDLPRHRKDVTPYQPVISIAKEMGAVISHVILGIIDEQHRKTELVIYKDTDIMRESPIGIAIGIDFAVGISYFFDIPLYIDEELKQYFLMEEEIGADMLKVLQDPERIM